MFLRDRQMEGSCSLQPYSRGIHLVDDIVDVRNGDFWRDGGTHLAWGALSEDYHPPTQFSTVLDLNGGIPEPLLPQPAEVVRR